MKAEAASAHSRKWQWMENQSSREGHKPASVIQFCSLANSGLSIHLIYGMTEQSQGKKPCFCIIKKLFCIIPREYTVWTFYHYEQQMHNQ